MTHTWSLDDGALVTLAANHLDVSEVEVFCISYQSWYSDAGPEALMERHFGDYLKRGEVPAWVRHFSREALAKVDDDESIGNGLVRGVTMMLWLSGHMPSRLDASSFASTLIA